MPIEDDERLLAPVLPRPRFPDEEKLLRPLRVEDVPPLEATLVLVDLLAEARPLEELLFLAALLAVDFGADAFVAAVLLEAPPVRDAELPLEDEVLLPGLDELPLEGDEDLLAPRLVPPLEDDLLAERLVELPDFLVPRADELREALLFDAALPFLATRFLVVLLAEANPLFAELFLEAVLFEDDFLVEAFFAVVFLAEVFFAADFFAVPLEVVFVAALLEPLLVVLDAVLEPPRPEVRRLEAALLRPEDLDADLDVDLPPALLEEVFLEAAFLVDFAIVNGF